LSRLLMLGLAMAILWTCPTPAAAEDSVLTLRDALSRALASNPDVHAARLRLEGARAWAEGAGALPNPELRLSGTSGDAGEDSNALIQRLEIAGQPGLRGRQARAEAQARQHELEQVCREVVRRTGAAYYGSWEASRRRDVAEERLRLAEELEKSSLRRLELGDISRNEHLRIELETARAQADLAEAGGEEGAARVRLNLLLGREAGAALTLPEDPGSPTDGPGPEPGTEILEERLLARPDLEALRARARAASLEAELAGRAGAPDLEFSAYRSRLFSRGTEQGIQLSLVVPLWDWGTLGAAESRLRREAEASRADLEAGVLRARSESESDRQLLLAARARLEVLAGQLERFRKLSEMARRGYEAGLLSFVEVLDTQQAFRQALLDHLSAQATWHLARLDLHLSSGGGLSAEEIP